MKKNKIIILIVLIAVVSSMISVAIIIHRKAANEQDSDITNYSSNTLPGADVIYPTILVDGEIYQWRMGRAVMNFDAYAQSTFDPEEFLNDMIYYGEIIKGSNDCPKQDREIVCVFEAYGSIYLDPNDEKVIYLWLTTDWFEDGVIAFDRVDKTSYNVAFSEGYDAGYEDGYSAGAKTSETDKCLALFSGCFSATVEQLLPDYCALPGNTIAVVHFFQDTPFLIHFDEDMTGQLIEGETYIFEFESFEVELVNADVAPAISDYMYFIKVTSYRTAREDERGLQEKQPSVEIVQK